MKTLKDMFIENEDYYFILPITSKYNLYIEGVNEDYCNMIGKEFDVNNIKHISVIELNDNKGSICEDIICYLNDISINMTCEELKDKVITMLINKSVL